MIVCGNCKSKNVERKAWVDANNDSVIDYVSDGDYLEDNWCRDCEDHVSLNMIMEDE